MMILRNDILYTILVFYVTIWSGVMCKTCEYRDRCSCVFDDGSGMVDLWALGYQDGTPQFLEYTAAVDSYLYSYNPCYPFTMNICTNAAVCQRDFFSGDVYYDVGDADKVSYDYDGQNLIVNYESADGIRTSHATYYCDETDTFPFMEVIGEQTTYNYYLNVRTISACTVPAPPDWGKSTGLSGGSILLIICFVLVVVYLIAGVTFNKVKLQAQGKDLVPNLGFWSTLPGLVKDGCKYSMSLICRKSSVRFDNL